jgi:tetratricopeptide (TPR) repeat protein
LNEECLRKAVMFFQCALEIEPSFAAAFAGLAHAYMDTPWYSLTRPSEVYPKAKDAASKALELDAGLSEAAAAVGHIKTIYDWDWEGAESKLIQAIDLNPGNATAHLWYAYYLTLMTQFDEAVREIEIALELDPLSLFINLWAGLTFYYAGENDRAIAAFQRTIEMDPNYLYAHSMLGTAYLRKSMIDKALEELEKERAISGGRLPASAAAIIGIYVMTGKMEDARNILDQMLARAEKEYVSPFMLAVGHVFLGESDKAFELLEEAFEERDIWLSFIKVLDWLDPIRSDPRYAKMLRKIGLEP